MMVKDLKKNKTKKIEIMAALFFSVATFAAFPVAAWFSHQREAARMVRVKEPNRLYITAGHQEDTLYFDLSEIDIEDSKGEKDFVFCVVGEDINTSFDNNYTYTLQLAHTTNIPFKYEIYNASESTDESAGAVPYKTHGDDKKVYYYSYTQNDKIPGSDYINQDSNTKIAIKNDNNVTYNKTYNVKKDSEDTTYDHVQKNAVPLYWQGVKTTTVTEGKFANYYILHITWGKNESNNKETDIVYIVAKSA